VTRSEIGAAYLEDARAFEDAAERLRHYSAQSGWFGRFVLHLIVGALNGKAGVLRAIASKYSEKYSKPEGA